MTAGLARACLGCGRAARNASRCPSCAVPKASTASRGYGSDWQQVRATVLERDRHTCQWCGGPANTVDHVIPLAHGGARLDPANLVSSCLTCNSRRGGRTRRKRTT